MPLYGFNGLKLCIDKTDTHAFDLSLKDTSENGPGEEGGGVSGVKGNSLQHCLFLSDNKGWGERPEMFYSLGPTSVWTSWKY